MQQKPLCFKLKQKEKNAKYKKPLKKQNNQVISLAIIVYYFNYKPVSLIFNFTLENPNISR